MAYFSRKDELDAVMDNVQRGNGGSVVICGAHGLGKTTLVKALLDMDSIPTALVTVNPSESDWPYSGVTAYLGAIDAVAGSELVAVVHRLGFDGAPFDIAQRISDILRRADLTEQLVVIDDADAMDPASQQVLGYVMRRKASPHIRNVLTTEAVSDDGPFVGIPCVGLEPLDTRALVRLGMENNPPTVSYAVLELLARTSAGNPLVFTSILGQLSVTELDGEMPLAVPLKPGRGGVERAAGRLQGLSDAAREALHVLSCGPFLPLSVADKVDSMTAEGVEELIERGLVGRSESALRVIDCSVSAAVYWSLGTAQRLELHRLLTRLSVDRCPGISTWHATFNDPDPKYAASLLEQSARLLRLGYVNGAAEFADRALGLSNGAHREQLVGIAKGFLSNAEYDLARRYLQFASGPELSANGRLQVSFNLVFLDYMQFQMISASQIMAVVGSYKRSHPQACAHLLCTAAVFYLELWEFGRAKEMFGRARALSPDDTRSLDAMEVVLQWYAAAFEGKPLSKITALGQQAKQVRRAFGESASLLLMARTLTLAERYSDAREILSDFLQFSGSKARMWTDVARHFQLLNELGCGRCHRAREISGLIRADQGSRRYFEIGNNLMDAVLHIADVEIEAGSATIRQTVKLMGAGQSNALEARLAVYQGKLALIEKDFDLAVDHYARAHRLGRGLKNPQLLRIHEDYVEALLLSGRRDDAMAVVADLRKRAAEAPSEWARLVLAKLDAQMLDGEESIAAFAELVDNWDARERHYMRARTMLSFSIRLRELGFERRGAEVHQDAAELLHEVGVQVSDEAYVRTQGGQARIPVMDLLDEKERPVVQLLVRGLKNRSIAKELFISVRTVELRLTNVYRKAGVKSRFELLRIVSDEIERSQEEESA